MIHRNRRRETRRSSLTQIAVWGAVLVIGVLLAVGSLFAAAGTMAATLTPSATWRGPIVTGEPVRTESIVTQAAPAATHGAPDDGVAGEIEYAGLGVAGDGTLRRLSVPVLMYHYISEPPADADIYRLDLSVTPDRFREQMQFLADHDYSVISLYALDEALRWGMPLPPNPVVLTFDDGYRDAYEQAFPILQEFGFTGTFFVITARLDEGHPAYITWEQAGEMQAAGMNIESHTKDHPNLRGRDSDFLVYQVLGSLESIEAHLDNHPRLFSYPSGRWDADVVHALPQFGVWAAVTTEGGITHTTDGTLLLHRVRVSGEADMATFAALLRWDWDRVES